MTHKTAAWYDYLTGRKLGLWVYDKVLGGLKLNDSIANNKPLLSDEQKLLDRVSRGLNALTGAVTDAAKLVGSYVYNTGFTGRWLLTLLNSRNRLKHAQLQQNKSFLLSKQFFDLKNSLGYKNLLQRKNQPDFSAQLAKQLDEYLSQLRRLKFESEGAQKLYLRSMAAHRGYQAQHLTALRHIPWASMTHTVANYNGLLTPARDIYDPRNWKSMIKGIPAEHKKVLDQQNTHASYTDMGDLIHASLLSNLVLPHGLAKATPVVAQTLRTAGSRFGMPWLQHAATPTVLAGTTVLGAGAQGLMQNELAREQRLSQASYGNPNQAFALIPGAVFANYGGFALLMDIQNLRRQRLTLALNTPDEELERRFNTQQLDKMPYIDAGTVYNAAIPAVLTRITKPLDVVDNFTNYLQYSVPAVPPDWRKYIQAADVSAQVALHTTSPGNSSVVNDNNLIAASNWVKDAYHYNFPGRRHQAQQNALLSTQPDLGFRFAGAVMNSELNKLPLPKLPDPRTLCTLNGTPKTPYAKAQLLSVITAYLLDNDNVFGAMLLLPGAAKDPRLASIKKYYKDSMENFVAGTPLSQRQAVLDAYYKQHYTNSQAWKNLTTLLRLMHWLEFADKLKLPLGTIPDYIYE